MIDKFEGVIFDMDGLLLDTERIALDMFNEALKSFGLEEENELFISLIGTNSKTSTLLLQEGLEGKVDTKEFSKVWTKLYKEKTTYTPIPVKNGVKALLNFLKSIDMDIAVATSTKTDMAIGKLENAGLIENFEIVVGGDMVQHGKPNPEIYLLAASKLGVNPKNSLALEDSENGVKSAYDAGLTVVQIPDLVTPSQSLQKLGHIILPSLDDVIGYAFRC